MTPTEPTAPPNRHCNLKYWINHDTMDQAKINPRILEIIKEKEYVIHQRDRTIYDLVLFLYRDLTTLSHWCVDAIVRQGDRTQLINHVKSDENNLNWLIANRDAILAGQPIDTSAHERYFTAIKAEGFLDNENKLNDFIAEQTKVVANYRDMLDAPNGVMRPLGASTNFGDLVSHSYPNSGLCLDIWRGFLPAEDMYINISPKKREAYALYFSFTLRIPTVRFPNFIASEVKKYNESKGLDVLAWDEENRMEVDKMIRCVTQID